MTITRRKIGILSLLMIAIMLGCMLMPTIASADEVYLYSFQPWRGSWLAKVYVYSKSETHSLDYTAPWMKVTSYLEQSGHGTVASGSKEVSGKDYVSAGARYWNPCDYFRTVGYHEWEWSDGSYSDGLTWTDWYWT